MKNDFERYAELQVAMRLAIFEATTDSDEFKKIWQEMENLKNKNGGMPPKKG
jgi:hypothetical protein